MDQRIIDLTLLLMFLTGWEEASVKEPEEKVFKTWKGFLAEILDELEGRKLIVQHRMSKSLLLTEKGKRLARELKEMYLLPQHPAESTNVR